MIRFERFYCLLADARECRDFDEFCRECGSTTGVEDVPQALRLLRAAWTMGHEGLTIRKIAEACDISMRRLAMIYGLPTRTVENWAAEVRRPPEWQLPLIAYAALSDHLDA